MSGPEGVESSDRELLEATVRLRGRIERLEAELIDKVAEIDRRKAFDADGALNVVAWLRQRCRMDGSRAGQLVRLARAGRADDEIRQALLAGRISLDEGRRIVRGLETYRRDLERHGETGGAVESRVGELRDALVESAETGQGPGELRRQIDSRRHRLAAESMVFDEWVAHQQRELNLYTTFDGMVDIRGTLDPAGAATVKRALDALSKPNGAGDEPTAAQRRADALVQLAKYSLDSEALPTRAGQRPHVGVTVSEQTLRAVPSANGTPPAELYGHGPISGEQARLLACDGEVTRIVHGADSEVLDIGRATRVVPSAIHKALRFRDGGCAFPKCDRPVEWCDAHHIEHWAHGGETSLDNLVLLCRRHHTEVHLRRLALRLEGGKLLVGTAPQEPERPPPRQGAG